MTKIPMSKRVSIFEFRYWLSKQPEFKCTAQHSAASAKYLEELVGETVDKESG